MDIKDELRFMNPLEIVVNNEINNMDEVISRISELNQEEMNEFVRSCEERFSEIQNKFECFMSKAYKDQSKVVIMSEQKQLENLLRQILFEDIPHREREFRLFKKCVRKYVSDDVYAKIGEDFNKAVTEYRQREKNKL